MLKKVYVIIVCLLFAFGIGVLSLYYTGAENIHITYISNLSLDDINLKTYSSSEIDSSSQPSIDTVENVLSRTSSLDDAVLVKTLYRELLEREPDEAGYDYWTGLLARGTSRAYIVEGFLTSLEYRQMHHSSNELQTEAVENTIYLSSAQARLGMLELNNPSGFVRKYTLPQLRGCIDIDIDAPQASLFLSRNQFVVYYDDNGAQQFPISHIIISLASLIESKL